MGNDHATTLKITAIAARLQHAQPGGAAAGKELLTATVAHMAEVLGDNHPQTCKYQQVLEEMGVINALVELEEAAYEPSTLAKH